MHIIIYSLSFSLPPAITEGLDLSQSSMIQGSTKGPTPIGYPYHSVSPELKEHWRILDEVKTVPFHRWEKQAILVWMETKLG